MLTSMENYTIEDVSHTNIMLFMLNGLARSSVPLTHIMIS